MYHKCYFNNSVLGSLSITRRNQARRVAASSEHVRADHEDGRGYINEAEGLAAVEDFGPNDMMESPGQFDLLQAAVVREGVPWEGLDG